MDRAKYSMPPITKMAKERDSAARLSPINHASENGTVMRPSSRQGVSKACPEPPETVPRSVSNENAGFFGVTISAAAAPLRHERHRIFEGVVRQISQTRQSFEYLLFVQIVEQSV